MNLLKNILELNRMKNWKEDRLKIIKEILPALGDNFYLKGGTALLFYYGLDRFSEDIDLERYQTLYAKIRGYYWKIEATKS